MAGLQQFGLSLGVEFRAQVSQIADETCDGFGGGDRAIGKDKEIYLCEAPPSMSLRLSQD